MKKRTKSVDSLLEWQPKATGVIDAGKCPICKHQTQLFYLLEGDVTGHRSGRVGGGYYCPVCQFANAGAYPADEYERAEKYE